MKPWPHCSSQLSTNSFSLSMPCAFGRVCQCVCVCVRSPLASHSSITRTLRNARSSPSLSPRTLPPCPRRASSVVHNACTTGPPWEENRVKTASGAPRQNLSTFHFLSWLAALTSHPSLSARQNTRTYWHAACLTYFYRLYITCSAPGVIATMRVQVS